MKKLKEIYLRITGNPLLGYIPLYIFTITDYITTTEIALISSFLACSLTFVLVVVLGGRGNVHAALFCAVSLISISILTILFLIPGFEEIKEQYHDYSQLFSEIVIASVLLLIVSLKGRIQRYFITTIRSNISATFLSSIDEYIYITRITLYILLAHMVT
ncbi:MAG: hypothetical protein LBD45_04405, partial [Bacteroidales bacterium]|nr:hypothetical protein [Bacteroidales bacterium]